MDEQTSARIRLGVLRIVGDMARTKLADPHLSEANRVHYEEIAAAADRIMAEIVITSRPPEPRERPWRLREKRTRADFDPSLNYGA